MAQKSKTTAKIVPVQPKVDAPAPAPLPPEHVARDPSKPEQIVNPLETLHYNGDQIVEAQRKFLLTIGKLEEDEAYADAQYHNKIIADCTRALGECRYGQPPGFLWEVCLRREVYKRWLNAGVKSYGVKAIEECKKDPLYFFHNFLWTVDPRLITDGVPGGEIPFILFDKQIEYLRWLQERIHNHDNGMVVKCRDMGFSWISCGYAVWGMLFTPGFTAGFGSNKADSVDKSGDMKSLLEKCRYLVRKVFDNHPWMVPILWKGYSERFHFKQMLLHNPYLGTSISGDAGLNMGTGDRKVIYFCDEWAKVEKADVVKASVSNVANTVIYGSTPMGTGNDFAQMFYAGKPDQFIFNWYEHPRKTQAWFDNLTKRKGYGKYLIAQEVLHDFNCSVEAQFIPGEWVMAAVEAQVSVGEDKHAGFDVAAGGDNQSVYIVREGNTVYPPNITAYNEGNLTDLAHKVIEKGDADNIKTLSYDVVQVGMGIRGTLERTDMPFHFKPIPIHGGSAASSEAWSQDYRPARERFVNRRAELWELLRERFRKTFEYVSRGTEHPFNEMISIPNNIKLIQQLSMPMREHTETGKIRVENKGDMKARGVKSPDYADALVYCYAEFGKMVLVTEEENLKQDMRALDIQWGDKSQYNSKHYAAVVQKADLSVWLVMTLWDEREGKLFVYDCAMFRHPIIPDIAKALYTKMHMDKYYYEKIVCNDAMMKNDASRTVQSLFREEFDKLEAFEGRVSEAFKYDLFGAVAVGRSLIKEHRITFDVSCSDVVRQLSSWMIEKGELGFDQGYCEALCLVISELKKQHVFEEIKRKPVDYMPLHKALLMEDSYAGYAK